MVCDGSGRRRKERGRERGREERHVRCLVVLTSVFDVRRGEREG